MRVQVVRARVSGHNKRCVCKSCVRVQVVTSDACASGACAYKWSQAMRVQVVRAHVGRVSVQVGRVEVVGV